MNRRENNFKQGSGHALDHAGSPVSEWDYLNNFFKCYNKVPVSVLGAHKPHALPSLLCTSLIQYKFETCKSFGVFCILQQGLQLPTHKSPAMTFPLNSFSVYCRPVLYSCDMESCLYRPF